MNKIIDFEAHTQAKEYVKEVQNFQGYPRYATDSQGRFTWYQSANRFEVRNRLQPKLDDLETRFRDMEESGVKVQVVSPAAPNCDSFPKEMGVRLSKINNDHIAELVRQHPDKFVGFGSLPMQDVDASLEELDRMKDIGLKGIMATSNVQGEHLDAKKFWPIFERAEDLSFPIFVHPGAPSNADMYTQYHMWGPVFGFGVDTAFCALRLIFSGAMEEYPHLNIILGHLGETIPFILKRIDFVYLRTPDALPGIKKNPSEYFLSNFYVDTAGIFHEPSLRCTLDTLDHSKIVFGSDYPFENSMNGVEFIVKSDISQEDKDRICWKNGVELLGLNM